MTRRATNPRTSRARTSAQADGRQPPAPVREPDLDLEIMTITPELAQEWLDRGGTNRKSTRRRIEAMTAAIQRGEWQLTGEAIKLDNEGRVRDGQNRLHPIVQVGIPVRSVVAHSVNEDAFDVMDTSFFLSRETVIPSAEMMGMALWRDHLFAWMSRNATRATDFFNIPPNRVVELGTHIEI